MKTQLAIATITAFLGGAWAAEKPASELKPAPPPLQAQKIELSDDSGSISVTTTSSGGGTMVVSTSGKTVITENGKTRVLTLKDGKWVEEAPAAVGKADTAGTAPVRLDPPPAITGTGTITGLGPLPELKTGSPTAIRPPSPDALENRLKKARLLETRADGVKVYEDADGTRIYKGENSLMVVSGGGTAGTVQIGKGIGGATVMGFGNITVTTGPNGEVLVSDEMPGGADQAEMRRRMEEFHARVHQLQHANALKAATPQDAARLQMERMKVQAEQLRCQAEALQKQAAEMQAMAQKLMEAGATNTPVPEPVKEAALPRSAPPPPVLNGGECP